MIASGGSPGHAHAYWQLQQPVDHDELEQANRRLAHHLGGDLASVDAARILRPPTSCNRKRNPPSRVELVVLEPGRRYHLAELTAGLTDPTAPRQSTPTTSRAATTQLDQLLLASCTSHPLTGTSAPSGTATCASSFSASASVSLRAVFTPTLTGSTSQPDSLTIAKVPTATSVTATTAAPAAGQNATYTADVTPANAGGVVPTGAVQFADWGAAISGCASQPVSASGLASCTVTPASGGHSLTAAYGGDANFSGSASSGVDVTGRALGLRAR